MNIKHIFVYILFALILGAQVRAGRVQAAGVDVDPQTFPDAHFREYILKCVDTDKDGRLSDAEIQKATTMKIEWQKSFDKNITNYQGIEHFTELRDLEIHGTYHASAEDDCDTGVDIWLDVSKNTKLTRFWCEAGSVAQLDLSKLPDLTEVELYTLKYGEEPYPVQDLRNCKKLSKIRVGKNVILPEQMPKLTVCEIWGGQHSIQFQASPKLQELDLKYDVAAEKVDLRNLPKLKSFRVSGYIRQIDLRGCKKLETVDTRGSWAKVINLSGCENLKKLWYHGNYLGKLDVREFRKLTYLDCQGERIKKLDVSKNKKLKYLYCDDCSLTKLLLAPKADYKVISCKNNKLKKLNCKNSRIQTLRSKGNKKIKVIHRKRVMSR